MKNSLNKNPIFWSVITFEVRIADNITGNHIFKS